jgi:hypothetical protein
MKFRQDLMITVIGDWEIEINKKTSHFIMVYANAFDEPVGGLMYFLLIEDS